MDEKLYIYETAYKSKSRESFQVRREAKRVVCLDCKYEWLIRKSRKSPIYCRECAVKKDRNPMYGKESWNKGLKTFNQTEFNRNYTNKLRWERKRQLVSYMGNQCFMCKQSNLPICVWQWHHIDGKTKVKCLSQMLMGKLEDLYEELNKCVLLCSNCHKIYHYGNERLNNDYSL